MPGFGLVGCEVDGRADDLEREIEILFLGEAARRGSSGGRR
jgi:hypothetical protein